MSYLEEWQEKTEGDVNHFYLDTTATQLFEEADAEIARQAKRIAELEEALELSCRDMTHPHLGDTKPSQWIRSARLQTPEGEETKKRTCMIFGSEIEFCIRDIAAADLQGAVKEIWEHPSKHWDVKDGSEDAYYHFLKFLWIRYPDGKEERLTDFAKKLEIVE